MKLHIKLILSLFVFIVAGWFAGFQKLAKAQTEKPNVLFISIDDLLATVGVYGDSIAVTPNIDELAESSVVFNRHYVQQASCAPSRTSMLTGLRPKEVGVVNHSVHFRDTRPDVVTLPQLFKNNGYHSVGIGKIFHFRHGYQDTELSWTSEVRGSNRGVKKNQYVLPENRHGGKAAATEKADVLDTAYPDGRFTKLALDYLRRFEFDEEPFFLAVGFMKPHLPFNAPSRYWDLYDRDDFDFPLIQPDRPKGAPDVAFHNSNEFRGYTDFPDEGPVSKELRMQLRHGYYASVSYIDAQVGMLMDELDELGLRDNTIVVLWSDHGYHLGELGLWGKSTNYEMAAHAPMMISVPDMTDEGARTNALVESVDIYPTLADLAGITPENELSGESLRPLLTDPDAEWRPFAFNRFGRPYGAAIGGGQTMTHMGYSVRVDKWRYTAWYNLESETIEYNELYPMDFNPDHVIQESNIESENLSGRPEYEVVENRLLKMLQQYRNQNYNAIEWRE